MILSAPTKFKHAGARVQPANYIYPPRSQDAIPVRDATIYAQLDWEAQYKYNDSRCLIKYNGNTIELWNRHAEQFRNYNAPDNLLDQLSHVRDKLGLSRDTWSLLDGGLLHAKHAAIKNTVVIWDILVLDGVHLLGSTYKDRHDFLTGNLTTPTNSWEFGGQDLGLKVTDDILIPRNYKGNLAGTTDNDGNQPGDAWISLWEQVIVPINQPYPTNSPLLEGLVFKNPLGKLERGMREKNNSSWMCRSRVQTGRHRF